MGFDRQFFQRVSFSDFRFFCLCLCFVLYGVWGSPTPDNPGWFEVMLGGLLVLASVSGRFIYRLGHVIGLVQVNASKSYRLEGEAPIWRFWQVIGYGFLVYCLSVPVLLAAIYGHDLNQVGRDLFAVAFFMMPILHSNMLLRREVYIKVFAGCLVWVGVCFSLRSWYPMYIGHGMSETLRLLYLSLSPSVLFAGILVFGMGVRMLSIHSFQRFCIGLCVFFAALCVVYVVAYGMGESLQRASLGLLVLGCTYLMILKILSRPVVAIFVIIPLILCVCLTYLADIHIIYEQLLLKNEKVAFNSRYEEFEAVLVVVSGSTLMSLFGIGWGGDFSSPAVGNLVVNYTHNIFSAGLLKTGLAGALLLCLYIFPIILGLFRNAADRYICALPGRRLLAVTLYANYKSMDFGALLLLGVALCRRSSLEERG